MFFSVLLNKYFMVSFMLLSTDFNFEIADLMKFSKLSHLLIYSERICFFNGIDQFAFTDLIDKLEM